MTFTWQLCNYSAPSNYNLYNDDPFSEAHDRITDNKPVSDLFGPDSQSQILRPHGLVMNQILLSVWVVRHSDVLNYLHSTETTQLEVWQYSFVWRRHENASVHWQYYSAMTHQENGTAEQNPRMATIGSRSKYKDSPLAWLDLAYRYSSLWQTGENVSPWTNNR